ncbi:hypothetical protein [Luteipulveratus halotolerans]|uniref:hypothetical protein n=1 Tax=Luteipulveratus halotolerans TaxID=1631356 RepID=UPI0018D116F9|nr:hypothetical protein [Luteipulveratus halotolerans]
MVHVAMTERELAMIGVAARSGANVVLAACRAAAARIADATTPIATVGVGLVAVSVTIVDVGSVQIAAVSVVGVTDEGEALPRAAGVRTSVATTVGVMAVACAVTTGAEVTAAEREPGGVTGAGTTVAPAAAMSLVRTGEGRDAMLISVARAPGTGRGPVLSLSPVRVDASRRSLRV